MDCIAQYGNMHTEGICTDLLAVRKKIKKKNKTAIYSNSKQTTNLTLSEGLHGDDYTGVRILTMSTFNLPCQTSTYAQQILPL